MSSGSQLRPARLSKTLAETLTKANITAAVRHAVYDAHKSCAYQGLPPGVADGVESCAASQLC